MTQDQISLEYSSKHHIFKRLEEEVGYIMKSKIHNEKIRIHTISSRVKDKESFINKAVNKDYESPFEQIHDIVGLRVVCLFLSDIERIGNLIRETFEVVNEDNKIDGGHDTSSFGYMSVHFVCKIKEEYRGERYYGITNKPFEIQVRTISMDAWANISHYLQYKSETDIPTDLRKDFHAISGLYYVADKHFEMFFQASQSSKDKMEELFEEPNAGENTEINLDSLSAYLFQKFPSRKRGNSLSISDLVVQIISKGYRTIGEIDVIVNEKMETFLEFEVHDPPSGEINQRYIDVGVIRIILLNEKFKKFMKIKRELENK